MKFNLAIVLLLMSSNSFSACRIYDVLPIIRPGAEWEVVGGTYQGLNWIDKVQVQPTLLEVQNAIAACQADAASRQTLKQQAKLDVKNNALTVPQRLQALLILLDYDR